MAEAMPSSGKKIKPITFMVVELHLSQSVDQLVRLSVSNCITLL